MSFNHPTIQGRHFLPFRDRNQWILQPSYFKSGSWLPHIGQSVTLCARATRAILNHAPIGEYKQCFFPAEYTQCPCGHCHVKTCQHIFVNKGLWANQGQIDPFSLVKNFINFLKKYLSVFTSFLRIDSYFPLSLHEYSISLLFWFCR